MRAWTSCAIVAALFCPVPANAAFSPSAAGSTGARFLELPASARAAAMGGAEGAVAGDASALHVNPGRLASLRGGSLVFTHSVYLQDMSAQHAAVARNFDGVDTLAVGVRRLGAGSIDRVDNLGRPVDGPLEPKDIAVSLGYARTLAGAGCGAALKYVSSELASTARTFALDLGAHAGRGPWSFSLSAQNLGPGLKFREGRAPLPMTLRAGSGLARGPWLIALDLIAPRGAGAHAGLGAEYRLPVAEGASLAVRAGFNSRTIASELGAPAGLSFGFGVGLSRFRLDYALTHFGELGLTHRVGASLGWKAK